ncbi:MAG: hypothetical protein WEB37_06565 [Bacteroidota bacterium]
MKTILSLSPILIFFFLFSFPFFLSPSVFAQSSDLVGLQSKLTVDCKSIRGHASRIVAEAAESAFNRDVAAAHLGQVARYHVAMESDLRSTNDLLDKEQRKRVDAEMAILLETCKHIGVEIRGLQKEFDKVRPDIAAVRRAANTIRNDMTQGVEVHDRLKKKLGII